MQKPQSGSYYNNSGMRLVEYKVSDLEDGERRDIAKHLYEQTSLSNMAGQCWGEPVAWEMQRPFSVVSKDQEKRDQD